MNVSVQLNPAFTIPEGITRKTAVAAIQEGAQEIGTVYETLKNAVIIIKKGKGKATKTATIRGTFIKGTDPVFIVESVSLTTPEEAKAKNNSRNPKRVIVRL